MNLFDKKFMMITTFTMLLFLASLQSISPCIADSAKVVGIGEGSFNSALLKDDGTVWMWGLNNGLYGDGTFVNRSVPVIVPIDNVKKLSVAGMDVVALKDDGTVWTWGCNFFGTKGDGTNSTIPDNYVLALYDTSPTMVPGLSDVTDIIFSGTNCYAIKSDGTVWAWGKNYYGSLGDGTNIDRFVPVQIKGLTGVTSVAAGGTYAIALDNQGRVWAWGSNMFGQLGDNTTNDSYIPKQIAIDSVKKISAGGLASFAIKNDGSLWAWGDNDQGQLGIGTKTYTCSPAVVYGIGNVIDIQPYGTPIIGLTSDGFVWQWGYNYGDFGSTITSGGLQTRPKKLDITNIVEIAAYYRNYLAIKSDGSLWSWGDDEFGQRGVNVFANSEDMNVRADLAYLQKPTKILVDVTAGSTVTATAKQGVNTPTSAGTVVSTATVAAGSSALATSSLTITTITSKPASPSATVSGVSGSHPSGNALSGVFLVLLSLMLAISAVHIFAGRKRE